MLTSHNEWLHCHAMQDWAKGQKTISMLVHDVAFSLNVSYVSIPEGK